MNYSKLCRICLCQDRRMNPVLESLVPIIEPQTIGVKDVWIIFAEILAIFEDELLNQICGKCFNEIQRTYSFVKKCEKSISYLKKISHKKEDAKPKQIDEIKVAQNDIAIDYESEILWSVIVTHTNQYEKITKDSDYSRTDHETNAAQLTDKPCNKDSATIQEPLVEAGALSAESTATELINSVQNSTPTQPELIEFEEYNAAQHTDKPCDEDSTTIQDPLVEAGALSAESTATELINSVQNSTPTQPELIEFEESQEVLKCTYVTTPSGKKCFQCSLCSEIFTNKDNLFDHMKIHSNEFPFNCEVCSTKFRSKEYFKVHLRCHPARRTIKCHGCTRGFRTTMSRNYHMLQKHPALQRKMIEEQHPDIKQSRKKKKTPAIPVKEQEIEKVARTHNIPVTDQPDKSVIASKTTVFDEPDDNINLKPKISVVNMEKLIQDHSIELENQHMEAATAATSNHTSNSYIIISDDTAESSDNDSEFYDVQSNESSTSSTSSMSSFEQSRQTRSSMRGRPRKPYRNSINPTELERMSITQIHRQRNNEASRKSRQRRNYKQQKIYNEESLLLKRNTQLLKDFNKLRTMESRLTQILPEILQKKP